MKKIDADDPMGKSADVAGDNFQRLRELFPEAFSEGRLDMQILRQLVGDLVVDEPTDASLPDEKYGLNWKGKRRARQLALTPSLGTLRPCPDESVDWDTTKNLMIEGDNLEVLKLLQKSYSGKVKLIYIDPPYNTGKDFVYPDNFHDNIRNYLELTGQVDGEGRKLTSNPESSGRFHTDWLNMMYPRLKLARNLLREDGFICVSIDENETHNLRHLLDEIFGSDNAVGVVVWKKGSGSNDTEFSYSHEQVVIYRKSEDAELGKVCHSEQQRTLYKNPDNDPRGAWASDNYTSKWTKDQRPNLWYPIRNPTLGKDCYPPDGRTWAFSQEETTKNIAKNLLWWGEDGGKDRPRYKRFRSVTNGMMVPRSWWDHVGTNEDGFKVFRDLGFEKGDFPHPKPLGLLKELVSLGCPSSGIVIDFFAGSASLGHAVMEMNSTDGMDRRLVLVQIPEPLIESEFSTIFDVARTRLRRVGDKVRDDRLAKWAAEDADAAKKAKGAGLFDSADDALVSERTMPDLGFRVFKLDTSNIRVWNPDPARLGDELLANVGHVMPGRGDDDLLYEMLLKLGLDLTEPIAERTIAGKKVVSIGNGALMACLEKDINASIVEDLAKNIAAWHAEQAPAGETTVFFRDSAFTDDVAKSNLTAILEQTFKGRKKDIRIRSI